MAEQRRLAYVGITRARDLLAIALPSSGMKGDKWLHTFAPSWAIPEGDRLELPGGKSAPCRVDELDGDGERPDPRPYRPRWFLRRQRGEFLREFVNPSAAEPVEGAAIGEIIGLGGRIPIRGDDMASVGSALHAVIAAELVNPERADAVARAAEVLKAYRVDAFVKAQDAVEAGRRLRAALASRYPGCTLRAECPISQALPGGRTVRGFVDLLLETEEALLVIDHKSSPRPRSEWAREALEHSGQLALYQTAITEASGKDARAAIHFAIGGSLISIVGPSRT
jgi:ATP-dependent exoDNAse (exonuclease V) beta subunit